MVNVNPSTRRALHRESGFALLELLVSIVIFSFVATAVASLLSSGVDTMGRARAQTLAEEIAASQLEAVRQMSYSNVGVVDGDPGGTLPATIPIAVSGLKGTETIQVSWVNDPAPTAYVTYADYKQVTVSITTTAGEQLTKQTTFVGPASESSYGGLSDGIIKAVVMDMGDNTPLSGVSVALSGGPSPNSSAVTDGSGTVIFPALTPNPSSGSTQYYNLTVTPPSGYTALPDDVSPNAPAHVELSGGQTFDTTLRVYQASSVTVNVDVAGAAYTGAATVTLTSSRPTMTTSLSNGVAQFTNVVPGVQYTANVTIGSVTFSSAPQTVPSNYPTNLTSTYNFSLPELAVTVYKLSGSTCTTVSGATVTVTGGPSSVNLSATSASNGTASFVVPAGSGYTFKATSGSSSKTLTSQTVQAAPATTSVPISITGSCT